MITGADLYGLLPAAFRVADDAAGGTVRALLDVLATQFDALDADLEQMGEDWFIETCAPALVPYIGELVGEHLLTEIEGVATPRARIANTIGYRRRKGTVAVLEALTRDTTGWPARAVEYYRRLAAEQQLADIRLDRPATVSLRDGDALELVGSPFDSAPYTVDVRRMPGARPNIPNVGLHVYRLGAYWVPNATARAAADPGTYCVDPLQRDLPLFNRPAPETEIEHLATESDVAARLRRRPLHAELDQRREDLADGRLPQPRWFGDRPPVRVFASGLEIGPERLEVCHLGDWRRPDAGFVAVDPVLGRITFPAGEDPPDVQVSAAYGFSGDAGAGPYDRSFDQPVDWQVGVSRDVAPVAGVDLRHAGRGRGGVERAARRHPRADRGDGVAPVRRGPDGREADRRRRRQLARAGRRRLAAAAGAGRRARAAGAPDRADRRDRRAARAAG